MTQRFIELQVSRAIYTDVTIAIDDEDPKYKTLFAEDGSLTFRGASLLKEAAAKAAANPPPAAPAQPEVPKWKRGMTAAEEAELKSYREYEAAQKRRAEEKKKQDKAAAAKATEDQFKAKARKITPDVIKTMSKDEVLGLVNNDTYRYLDRKQKDALMMRGLEIRAGR